MPELLDLELATAPIPWEDRPKSRQRLPNAFDDGGNDYWGHVDRACIKPLVELEMTALSATLRLKASWWTNFRDRAILDKWRAEALAQAKLMEESHIDYVLKELDGYAKLRDEESGAEVACYDRIWQSDKLIPELIKAKLVAGVTRLENTLDPGKHWRPRSNGLVLDLVHPSLYPIVYNRTLAYPPGLTDRDTTKLRPVPPKSRKNGTRSYHVSEKFQWLPTDFVVSGDGKSVKSVSYINNLNPHHHHDLHKAIEEIIGRFLPLFERVLTDSIPNIEAVPERTWPNRYRVADVPSRGYTLGSLEQRRVGYKLAERTIQVIVKLENIHLTPEKPEYLGDSWHIEGMSNEAIAASGVYCFAEENITESRMAFRTAVSYPSTYKRGIIRDSVFTWGISSNDPLVNKLGAVVACQGRAIAFPNNYQHRVSPFELKDKTKPGHRKIVTLLLVDPSVDVLSTTTVPPQQHEWRSAAISANPVLKAAFDKLAPETIEIINSFADGTMTRAEAEAYRLELMDERKEFVHKNNLKFFEVAF
ncbi:hypothetical protein FRC08_007385 [Ceratobasidium sp. 394]|nr:hypothetical protein FRC08_007385 [Ceratobasidium sp. 394]KAG9100174.1 hypothetical protein FS749_016037 [Ceratobasidium sp. UAMH 11750]